MRPLDLAKNNKGHVATGGAGIAVAGIAVEMFRLYSQASEKVDVVKDAAFTKAAEAGALQQALNTCLDIVRSCAQ